MPRTLPVRPVRIIPATDLGRVEVVKRGNLYLLTDDLGDIRPDDHGLGLYDLDTRILSSLILRVEGVPLTMVDGPERDGWQGTIRLANPDLGIRVGRSRWIDAAFHETVVIETDPAMTAELRIQLGLGVDMADIFEVRGYQRERRGRLRPVEIDGAELRFGYEAVDDVLRTTAVRAPSATFESPSDHDAWPGVSVIASWRGSPRPADPMTLSWSVHPARGGDRPAAGAGRRSAKPHQPEAPGPWAIPRIRSDSESFDRTLARSEADLAALRNVGPGAGETYLAAGVPWFTTLFGRDSIIAALELVAFLPSLATSTLEILGRLQATTDDPGHDAEPGKIVHEIRTGEMARTGEVPYAAYYGSIDATPLWLILLGETHVWTGDDALLDRLWPNALAALDWIDRSGDLDGDGFVEYLARSSGGALNQGWKDSDDSIRHVDGRLADGPIALAEVQGYVFAARRTMARLARRRGEHILPKRLDAAADALRDRFDAAFWLPRAGFYAMALDGDKRPVATIGSNVGQALWSRIIPGKRIEKVVDRLFEPDLFSGWGIRTFAADEVGYDPLGYHTGSVWPHDNAIIAAGLKWHGAADRAGELTGGMIDAAGRFPGSRLPELFGGYSRAGSEGPVAYPVACSPQAWSAAAPYLLLQTMLGLRADAPARRLEVVRASLPDGLNRLRISGLPVGDASVDLQVRRDRDRTSVEVLERRGEIEVAIDA